MDKLRKCFTCFEHPEEDINPFISTAIQVLENRHYRNIKLLGCGAYGDVVAYQQRNLRYKVAVKIADKNGVPGEDDWPSFNHENVLSVKGIIREQQIKLFIVPYHKKTLQSVLDESSFSTKLWAFIMTKRWIREVLCGLEYLHRLFVSYLNLQSENVLISEQMTALICDFSYASHLDRQVTRYGLKPYCCPPEACKMHKNPEVKGIPFDVWSFGIFALDVWTGKCLESSISNIQSWKNNVYPVLFQNLQYPAFKERVVKLFPHSRLRAADTFFAWNLILSALRHGPEKRPGVSFLLQHSVWSLHFGMYETDQMWSDINQLPGSSFSGTACCSHNSDHQCIGVKDCEQDSEDDD